ncbi:MAG: hypothetical protein ABW278_08485 [Steroidobacteraceae bacterium]
MKKLIAAFALAAAAVAGPALADVGVSIQVGEPGFYGRLDIGGYQPRLVYSQPVLVDRRYRDYAPVYVRVPPGHQRDWNRYCGRYDACGRPVYFVRDEWYRDVYAPRYRQQHHHDRHDDRWDRRDDRRDNRYDARNDRRDDRHDNRNDRRDDRRDNRDHRGRN